MPKSSRDSTPALSLSKKLVFGLITTAGFFAILEVGLALYGVQRVTESGDPFVGFSRQIPLLKQETDEAGVSMVRTAPGKLVWFNLQSFPAKKPAGTRRVFCVGGSTTFGRPFDDLTSYCGWLRELLPMVDSSVRWEVINAGGVSYASYRVAAVMEELSQYEPDLFIVYSAHNEFLERRTYQDMFEQSALSRDLNAVLQKTRTWALVSGAVASTADASESPTERLPGEVDEMLNHSIGPKDYHRDDDWQKNVIRHYEWNLGRMVSIAREAGAEIVMITPASNLRDCGPFKTESSPALNDDMAVETEQQLEVANLMLDEQRFEEATETCTAILSVDDRNAMAHFLGGRALFAMGRYAKAKAAFRRAVDEDVCPLRATTPILSAVRRAARRHRVPLVDFQKSLDERCLSELGHSCLGSEYFLDHVHPTIDVHRELALWIIAELQSQSWVDGGPPSLGDVSRVQNQIESRIDKRAQGVAFRNLAKVMHWSGKFQEAASRARDAIRLIPDDLESHFVLADCLVSLGRPDEGLEQYNRLFALGEHPRAYLPFGELLVEIGDLDASKAYLLQATLTDNDKHRARAFYFLGSVHLQLGEYELASESLREVLKLFPNDKETLALLDMADHATASREPDPN